MDISVIYPESNEAKAELSRRVAQAHAQQAIKMLQKLSCTAAKKQQLMDAAIAATRATMRG